MAHPRGRLAPIVPNSSFRWADRHHSGGCH